MKWICNYLKSRKQRVVLDGAESDWRDVTSGVPQGSVLGPLLFLIYINDLPDSIQSTIKLFADDAKLFRKIITMDDCRILQDDIYKMEEWSRKWQLNFNIKKCFVLRVGKIYHPDVQIKYYMITDDEIIELRIVDKIKDLGVITDEDFSYNDHIEAVTNKANKMWGIIRRTFTSLDICNLTLLYKTLVRSHLEYAAPVWSPHQWNQAEKLESVQRRATRMMPGLKNISYENRLIQLQLPSLVYRRIRGDLILYYKISHQETMINLANIELDQTAVTRGNDQKLVKKRCNMNKLKYSYTFRIVNWWNSLPNDTVNALSLNSFKNQFDDHTSNLEIKYNYRASVPIPFNL